MNYRSLLVHSPSTPHAPQWFSIFHIVSLVHELHKSSSIPSWLALQLPRMTRVLWSKYSFGTAWLSLFSPFLSALWPKDTFCVRSTSTTTSSSLAWYNDRAVDSGFTIDWLISKVLRICSIDYHLIRDFEWPWQTLQILGCIPAICATKG